jgi:hypothetical protein
VEHVLVWFKSKKGLNDGQIEESALLTTDRQAGIPSFTHSFATPSKKMKTSSSAINK